MYRLSYAALLLCTLAPCASAAPIRYLHHFDRDAGEGANLEGGVALSAGRLFGTTNSGNVGTIFAIDVDGGNFQTLHAFAADGSEGTSPVGKPIVVGDSVYGVTQTGFFPNNGGTIWAIDRNGTNFRVLHYFGDGTTGASPFEGVRLIENRLYGTTNAGGPGHFGTLYSLNLDGSDFQILHSFSDDGIGLQGRQPVAAPIQIGGRIYGTATGGGAAAGGIVYSLKPDGSDFQIVHSFPANSFVQAGVIAVGNRLFGAAINGGEFGDGAIYRINIDGGSFEVMHSFARTVDGDQPSRDLITDGTRLFGTTFLGVDSGVAYSLLLDGSDFELLHVFTDIPDGRIPNALILDGSNLYGTTRRGGLLGFGTVFAITIPEPTTGILMLVACVCLVKWWISNRFSNRRRLCDDAKDFSSSATFPSQTICAP